MSRAAPVPDVKAATQTEPREETHTRRVPPYNVILENDDHHSMEFVIEVLCKVLGCPVERAYQLMLEAHTSGRAVIWTGTREVMIFSTMSRVESSSPPGVLISRITAASPCRSACARPRPMNSSLMG